MNNCYLWIREQQQQHAEEEPNVEEEQDRSLHVVEVCLPTVRQPFQQFDQVKFVIEMLSVFCFDPLIIPKKERRNRTSLIGRDLSVEK